MQRIREATLGLRQALNALTNDDGNADPQVAQAIGCSHTWLSGFVADTRWLLDVLERVQQSEAA
jgi:hypothetical protein